MMFLLVFFSTNFQYKISSNINEHSLPATRSDMLTFLLVFSSTNFQYKTQSNINEHSLHATRSVIVSRGFIQYQLPI
jgi:hypothetical protein